MINSRLKNKYTKNPTVENCEKISKKAYYRSIDIKIVTTDIFGKIFNYSQKHTKLSKVMLIEKDDIISKDKHIAEEFNNFFFLKVTHVIRRVKMINIQKFQTF